MRTEGNKLYVVDVVKRTLSPQDVTHRFRRNKPRSGFPPNGAQLFLTVFLTVLREVSFEYTKIAYRVLSVKRCGSARYFMNSNVKEEKNGPSVKDRVERWGDNGEREVSGEKVVEKCH